tara:strand:- start:39 stop:1877 length:1839 start_codon:yes stop_codon:yes gene_type:complete
MSTYKNIHGKAVKSVSTNLSDSGAEGQIWFNTTDNKFRSVVALEAWSSASPLIVARDKPGNAGTQTAALAFGGSPNLTSSVEYNGTGWKSAPALNAGKEGMGSGGTTSAAWKAGGNPPTTTTATEEYNGSSWTTVPGTLNSGRYIMGSCGTQTAGLCCGGYNGSGNNNESEEYNGTAWSEGNNLNTARRTLTTFGIQTAAIAVGGQTPSVTTATESYDGTSWTTLPATYPVAFSDGSSSGTQTAGLIFGGYTSAADVTTTTRKFDGTTYSSAPSMGTATARGAAAGSQSATLAFGGTSPNPGTVVEEFNISANVITAAAWASGTALPISPGEQGTGVGQTAEAYLHGGYFSNPTSTNSNKYFIYDGSTHSSIPNTTKTIAWRGSNGSSTSGLVYGGYFYPGGSGPYTNVESYNGSSWSNETAIPIAEYGYVGAGPSETAAIVIGGDEGPTTTHLYDGSSWTSGSAYPFGGYQQAMAGTQTAAIASCGIPPSGAPGMKLDAYEYNGSSWTATGSSLEKLATHAIRGTQTAALSYGGVTLPTSTGASFSQNYDGSVFSTNASLGTARRVFASGGGTASSVVTSGGTTAAGSSSTATEEFSLETSTLNVKTLTQS